MPVINQFSYNVYTRIASLIEASRDPFLEHQIPIFYPRTHSDLMEFDHTLAPCAIKLPRLELAVYATCIFGGTRIGKLVFLQKSVAEEGPLLNLSEHVFYRKPYGSRKAMWDEVDKNDTNWTEVRIIGAKSRQLKYNLCNNSSAASPPELYDVFLTKENLYMRLKSARDRDAISPDPFVFTELALFSIRHQFPCEDGDWSSEQTRFLTQKPLVV